MPTPTSILCRLSLLLPLIVATASGTAFADDSAYCRKVRARAGADASLLFAPTIRAEAVRLPLALQPGGAVDATSVGGAYQIRAGLSLSPLDIYKGARVLRAGDADCRQHDDATVAQELLSHASDAGRLPALRSQLRFLEERQPAWQAIAHQTEQRLAARLETLVGTEDVRTRIALLERLRAQVRGDIERREASGAAGYAGKISDLIAAVETSSKRFEREASHVRALAAWDVRITAGYVPPVLESPTSDFFGVAQVSYNLGGPWHDGREAAYRAAREDEVGQARYELPAQLRIFRQTVASALGQARAELGIADLRAASLAAARAAIDGTEATGAPHARGLVELETILTESDRVFLKVFIAELSRFEEQRS